VLGRANGAKLARLSANVDPRPVHEPVRAKSVGSQSALGRRTVTPALLRETLGYLADRVAGRLRAAHLAGRTVTVRVRFTGLRSVTRSLTLPAPVSATLTLTEMAVQLAQTAFDDHPAEREVTLLAVSVSNLRDQHSFQPQLEPSAGDKRWGVDRSVDAIRDKFGPAAVGYATVVFSGVDQVPDEFRQLAERSLDDR
jgi:DNA polymerase-4